MERARAWRNDRFLLVRAPKGELYDLVTDPGATRISQRRADKSSRGCRANWSSSSGNPQALPRALRRGPIRLGQRPPG